MIGGIKTEKLSSLRLSDCQFDKDSFYHLVLAFHALTLTDQGKSPRAKGINKFYKRSPLSKNLLMLNNAKVFCIWCFWWVAYLFI
jgi:hypothetical protein